MGLTNPRATINFGMVTRAFSCVFSYSGPSVLDLLPVISVRDGPFVLLDSNLGRSQHRPRLTSTCMNRQVNPATRTESFDKKEIISPTWVRDMLADLSTIQSPHAPTQVGKINLNAHHLVHLCNRC